MATKTISIDLDAYRRLSDVRKENESFSQVIKRVIRPPFDLKDWLRKVAAAPLSDEAVSAIEEQVASRRSKRQRSRRRTRRGA